MRPACQNDYSKLTLLYEEVITQPEAVAKEIGFTYNPAEQIGGISLKGLAPEDLAALKAAGRGPDWEFTDRRVGSPTEGVTFYVPVGSSREAIILRLNEHLKQRGLPEFTPTSP
jgi:hypothetical protein